MSLIGSLEDLNLGDILQIISLSQKSGALNLRTRGGDGKIVFVDGLVRGAQLKEGAEDLRGVLVGASFMTDAGFDEAVEEAQARGIGIEKVIAERTSLGQERVDSLLREAVETVVVSMFGWKAGEFSFDIQSGADPIELPLTLPVGINAQYLAMEGLRVRDEAGRGDATSEADSPSASEQEEEELSAHEMFGVAPPEEEAGEIEAAPAADPADAVAVVAAAAVTRVDDEEGLAEAELIVPAPMEGELEELAVDGEVVEAREAVVAEADAVAEGLAQPVEMEPAAKAAQIAGVEQAPLAAARPASEMPPAVVIDLDLAALEWAKTSLSEAFSRVHIFQNSDLGLNRIRQYLARAEIPIVLVSPELAVDRLGGICDIRDFVRRLKSQATEMQVVWLGDGESAAAGGADGAVARPASTMFNDPRRAEELSARGAELADYLRQRVEERGAPALGAGLGLSAESLSTDELGRLKEATGLLSDASKRGEVLPLVIRFAGETFARVAMFMVRENEILGMAQVGMEAAGGPGDAAVRDIALKADSSAWFREILGRRAPVRAAPSDDGDRTLATLLGDGFPAQAYLAPIESGGQVIAVLYADNLPADRPLGDTSALEVVLHHAGLAIDRAALERALSELVE